MTRTQAYEALSAMGSPFNKVFSSTERTLIAQLYGQILGKTIKNLSCGDCYRDAYIEIITTLKDCKRDAKIPRYRLKEGETLHIFGETEYVTNPISDEVAERYLQRFPNLIFKFSVYPDDWGKKKEVVTEKVVKRRGRTPSKK